MVDNELITKVRVRNVKSILSNVFTSSGGTITNGNGTTANSTAVDLGGTLSGNVDIDGSYTIGFGQNTALTAFNVNADAGFLFTTGANTWGYSGGLLLMESDFSNQLKYSTWSLKHGITDGISAEGFQIDDNGTIKLRIPRSGSNWQLNLGSDATGDQYHRNASGYLVRRGTVIASSTSSLTINSDTTYQYSLTALAAALSIEAPTGTPFNGQDLLIRILDNGTARALTWNSIFRVIGVTLPTTTVISKTMYIACIYNSTDTKWDVIGVREQE